MPVTVAPAALPDLEPVPTAEAEENPVSSPFDHTLDEMARPWATDPVVTDAIWGRIEPLLPERSRRRRHPGRRPLDDRAVLGGILVVLARDIGFERLPRELGYGSGMTCWRRLRDWQRAGVWCHIAAVLIEDLPEAHRVDFGRVVNGVPDGPVTRRPRRTMG